MKSSASIPHEPNSTGTLLAQPGVLVAKRHHILVRCSHWLNIPLLLGLILSGISIYWSSPVYQHQPDPVTGNFDVAADVGIWIWLVLINRRRPVNGDAAQSEANKERHVQPVTPAHQDMVSFDHEHAWLYP